MKPFLLITALATLAMASLTACADPSRAHEADELRDTLAGLSGVDEVELDYTEPVFLDSGKVKLRVVMSAEADPAAITMVVVTAYEGFSGTHHREEGDVFVAIGDDMIHLRSFEPRAKADAVGQATTHAIAVLATKESVRVDINTQDVDTSAGVFTSYAVTIPGKGADDVLRLLTDLEQAHGDIPDASWGVQTGDWSGWHLSSSEGFPSPKQRAVFNRIRGDLIKDASILMTDDFITVQVPTRATTEEISVMVDRHLELLGGAAKASYDVISGENFYLMITVGDCTFAPGEVGARLELNHGASCRKITPVGD